MGVLDIFKPDIEGLLERKDITGLINLLGHRDERVQRNAIQGLIKLGESAIEPLIAAVMYNDSKVREGAAEALGEINDYMVVIIRGGLVKYVNSAVTRITGYAGLSVRNKQFTEFVAPEEEELVLERYRKRLMDEKVPSTYQVHLLSKKGERIRVELRASRIEFEGQPADLAILKVVA